jgi:uncharacterized protein YcbX
MLVDEQGRFMTQREFPMIALFKLKLEEAAIRIQFGSDSISLPFQSVKGNSVEVKIWDDAVSANEESESFRGWFSERLKINCKLVSFPEQNLRPVDSLFQLNNENVSLADAYPFLIIGQSSLDYLNTKLEEPLPMNRFRPNFVFTGGEAHEEDTWKNFTIGTNSFTGVKPCARCVLTTVNQQTAEKGIEPLRTLSTYRKKDNKILFGQNLLALNHHEVKVGDAITIQTRVSLS